MEKKTIIIISIISAIFSLVYMLLNYFGLLRYLALYIYPVESYSKNYKNLDKIGSNKTVISLTVSKDQLNNLTHCLKSLLDQTVKVDLISVIIPYGTNYKTPNEIKNSISVFNCGKDNGTLNCLLTAVTREAESTTKIITLEGNKIYGKDFIETLLEESNKNPNSIIYSNNSNIIDLKKGVVFKTDFFKTDFLDVPDKVNYLSWINTYFKNHPKIQISYSENYTIM